MPETQIDSAFDSKVAQAFAGRLLNVLNSGALCLMVSVGHRAGLFDVLRKLPPATCEAIAARAGLRRRFPTWTAWRCPRRA